MHTSSSTNIRNSEQIMELLKTPRSRPKVQPRKTEGKKVDKTCRGDKTGVNNLRYKSSPINKESTLKNSQQPTTKERIITLLNKSTPNGYIINRSVSAMKSSEYKRRGDEWPSWIPCQFKPPDYMNLDDTDFALAAYVFAPNKSSDQLLVRTNKFLGTRTNLESLIPKEWVLDLVATMLTLEEREIGSQTHWYLPATFSLCLTERQMIMLDSLPILASQEGRRPTIKKLGEFLQEMLEHESFYKYKTPFRPQISDYTFVDTLKTGEQASGSLTTVQG
ncbi:hypothetical protein PIB30_065945 [Stylosanthes scabra]|uniref:Uncharacterized protein n=1 Tax=Stylosanthes scabra TaxID=79078 RepID=A0ABU6YNG6_9FABA|nr:hypothetical protein [Stylosanthes scabra]